jgi:hypothetical protein
MRITSNVSSGDNTVNTTNQKTTRRKFLAGSATAAGLGAALAAAPALAQAPGNATPAPDSVVKFIGPKVTTITMVVKDAEQVARNFTEVFGPSWKFYEFRPKQVVLHDKPLADDSCLLKLAIGNCGGHTFKLVQPVSGQSSYAEFLAKEGEGYYSIGLGVQMQHDQMVEALKSAGVGIEMQGEIGDGSKFTVLQTAADLGLRLELNSPTTQPSAANLRQTGSHMAGKPGIIDMDLPVVSSGRRFTQIGIVVKDDKAVARRYEELLGVTGWRFIPIPVSAAAYRGQPLTEAELPSATVDQAVAYIGDTQIELLCPNDLSPGGVHRHFLDKHGSGNGFQHLMISPSAGNRTEALAAMAKAGFKPEWTATVHIGKMTGNGDYVGMEERLGGFLLEFNG